MQMKSSRSSMNELLSKIKTWIHDVFNRDFFSLYEAVVESYDSVNSIVSIRIPELSDIQISDCRYAYPARGVKFPLRSGDHVIVGFTSFDISRPIVFGYLPATDVPEAFIDNTIILENGNSRITMTSNSIVLESNSITANGEDLTYDDEGSM